MIHDVDGSPSIFYIGWYIRDAQRHPEVPRLTDDQRAAMDLIETIANDPAFHVEMDFRPGDIQLLNNAVILHAREAYDDYDEPERKRHLLRLWLSAREFASVDDVLRTASPSERAPPMFDRDLARRASAEAVGTALLVAIVVGSGIAAQRLSPGDVGLQLLENSIATGAGLVALILALGPVSGAHFNPVVTLADRLLGGISTRDASVYAVAQVVGGCVGDRRQPHVRPVGGHVLDAHAVVGRAVAGRVVATFGLLLVILGVVRAGVHRSPRTPSAATSPPRTGSRRRRASRTRR